MFWCYKQWCPWYIIPGMMVPMDDVSSGAASYGLSWKRRYMSCYLSCGDIWAGIWPMWADTWAGIWPNSGAKKTATAKSTATTQATTPAYHAIYTRHRPQPLHTMPYIHDTMATTHIKRIQWNRLQLYTMRVMHPWYYIVSNQQAMAGLSGRARYIHGMHIVGHCLFALLLRVLLHSLSQRYKG